MADYPVILSSESTVILKYYGEPYVNMASGADLTWLNSGRMGLFLDHEDEYRQQVGTFIPGEGRVEDGRVVSRVRMWPTPEGQRLERVLRQQGQLSVSVGFSVQQWETLEEKGQYGELYQITQWRPMECSVVGVPADPTAIIYHEGDDEQAGTGRPSETQPGAGQGLQRGRHRRRRVRYARRARGGRPQA